MVQMSGSEGESPEKDVEIGGDECGPLEPGDESLPLAKEAVSEGAGADQHGEDAYGSSSQRALRAFDAIPGDSEHQVDYPVSAEALLAPQVGTLSNGYEALPELRVELVVTTPDGRSFVFSEAAEVDTAEYEEISEMIAEVARSAKVRFVSRENRRQVLGL
jgi:hypothetical protein